MLESYVEIRKFLPGLKRREIAEITLTCSEDRRIDALILQLKPLMSVTKELQKDSTNTSDTRALFDAVIEEFPETCERLKPSAGIVHCPLFESALVKIQGGNYSALSFEERSAVSFLRIEKRLDSIPVRDELSFAEQALKKQRITNENNSVEYTDTRFLL